MTDDDAAEETRNKLSQRFGNEKRGNDDKNDNSGNSDKGGNGDKNDKNSKNESREKKDTRNKQDSHDGRGNGEQQERREPWDSADIERIKDRWSARTYYFSSEVTERMDHEFDRLQYECRNLNVKQARHFVPVLIEYGLKNIEKMDGEDFKEALKDIGVRIEQEQD